MINKKIAAMVAASGMAITGLALGIVPAKAFDPVAASFVVVGSDTLEDAVGALANGYNGVRTTTADSSTIGSFDATGTSTIITKPNGVRFERPNGSGDGRSALQAIIAGSGFTASAQPNQLAEGQFANVDITGQVDISRGSSGGTVDNTATGVLARYTFGRDAIAFAYGRDVTPGANGYISADDMKLLYQCDSTTISAYHVTNVVIPQTGSGTRKDFLSKLGITDDSTFTSRGCLKVGQEHDASNLLAGEIMPMSASRWIAMQNGVSYKKIAANVSLGSLVSGTQSVTGTAPNMTPVVAYYKDSTWGRDTYLFVDKRRVQTPLNVSPTVAVASSDTTITLANTQGITVNQNVTSATSGIFASGTKVSAVGVTANPTAVVAKGGTVVNLASVAGLSVGNPIGGSGIDAATTISVISGNNVTLSKATTAALATTTVLSIDNGVVTLNKATTGAVATTGTITFASPSYVAVLAKLFDYTDETSLTYQGGTSFSYANMTDANYPSFAAYTAAAVKLKFGFLPSSVQDKQFAHN